MQPEPGLLSTATHTVSDEDTALALRSGDVPVLATPRLIAWAEESTVDAVAASLDEGATSVSTRIQLEHLRPTPVGGTVTVTARLVHVDGRHLRFEITAVDDEETMVAHGQITRVIVDRDRFLSRSPRR